MIVCPHCNHANPDGTPQCESCHAPLPTEISCPHCSASVPLGASFCGQCGAAVTSDEMTAMAESAIAPVTDRASAATALHVETVLQTPSAQLIHVQTDRVIPLPDGGDRFRIGKPNDRYPPDLDVSGFAHSEIVSRVHAEIRLEGQTYYIEDVGSSNGTYVNFMPLRRGTRHALQTGDRIALGKGDLVTFEFKRS